MGSCMFLDLSDGLLELSNRIWDLMKKTAENANLRVEDQDARLVALSGMQEAVLSCAFWLHTYYSIAEYHRDKSMVLKYAHSNLPLEKTENIMLNQIRLGLVVFFHFKLEQFLSSLLNKISNKNVQGIEHIFTGLSQEIGLNDVKKKAGIIKAFSSIRNSLHNNGIHIHPSFSIEIDGISYEFTKDGVVQCASLGHCINLIQAIISIIEDILESAKIQELKGIIPESYSEWVINQPV